MSCGSASTSTRSPAATAVADVIGPIETTIGSRRYRSDEPAEVLDRRRRREGDRVELTRAHALEIDGIGLRGDRAVHGHDVDGVAPSGESFGKHVARLLGAREQHASPAVRPGAGRPRAATRRRSVRARGRRRTPNRSSAAAVPGPIAAICTPASARASRPRAMQPAVEERVDAVRGGEHDPCVIRQVGKLELDRLHLDRRELDHLGAELDRAARADRSPAPGPASPRPGGRTAAGVSNQPRSSAATAPTTIADGDSTASAADRRERGANRALLRMGAPAHRGHRRFRRAAAGDQQPARSPRLGRRP